MQVLSLKIVYMVHYGKEFWDRVDRYAIWLIWGWI